MLTFKFYFSSCFYSNVKQAKASMKLIVDTREREEIKEKLRECGQEFTVEALNVADYHVTSDNGEILMLIERKSCKDLAASMGDGRYREQKIRLIAHECPRKAYILEGVFPEEGIKLGKRVVTKSTYTSVVLGLSIRDKFLVFQTQSAVDTGEFLVRLMKKFPEYVGQDSSNTVSYQESLVKNVSTVKKENMTPELCYKAQLCQIPGISFNIASAIANVFTTMSDLLLQSEDTLCNISIGKRKLGKVLAQRIVNYMMPKAKKQVVVVVKKGANTSLTPSGL